MSAAATRHSLEIPDSTSTPTGNNIDLEEEKSLERLAQSSPPGSGPIIAVDLDDVLSRTNQEVAECISAIQVCRTKPSSQRQGTMNNLAPI